MEAQLVEIGREKRWVDASGGPMQRNGAVKLERGFPIERANPELPRGRSLGGLQDRKRQERGL